MTMKASLYLVIAISLCVVVLQWPIPASEGQTQEETNKVRLDEKSLYIDTQSVSFRILGEVVNETEFIISARVIVTAKDVNGKVRNVSEIAVYGETVDVGTAFPIRTDSGIFPGKSAPFWTVVYVPFDSIATIDYNVNFWIANPRSDVIDTPLAVKVLTLDEAAKNLAAQVDSLSQHHEQSIRFLNARIDSLKDDSTSSLLGDLDSDGDVDFSDFLLFARNFGRRLPDAE